MRSFTKRRRSRVRLYAGLFSHWVRIVIGHSYWHAHQGLGKTFVPGKLVGYYNDLTEKVRWEGPVDAEGLPLNRVPDGNLVHLPTTLFQKALGHWDIWLEGERAAPDHCAAFLRIARWALAAQNESGGWEVWPRIGLRYASPYSAMTQGEGISVLVRAFSVAGEEAYLEGARRALSPLLAEVSEGGTCRMVPEGLILEEIPLEEPATILNGWIFALYGLYDISLVHGSAEAREALGSTLDALAARLPGYDAGFWSYYDTKGNMASPFYHNLHVAQLRALELSFPGRAASFALLRKTFERQASSRLNLTRAVTLKGYQKLRHPPEVVLR